MLKVRHHTPLKIAAGNNPTRKPDMEITRHQITVKINIRITEALTICECAVIQTNT
jgi:hypothetical protein